MRYLAPLLPLGSALFGIWVLLSGSYTYRPGRNSQTVTLLPPDSQLMGLFFLSLAVLISAFGVSGRRKRWLFRGGLAGALLSLTAEGFRQLAGLAVYDR
ncbi:hypothetical protein SAMN05518845_102329 [Variovorax sp. YR750]|uniref:hypothetical protein n=1 Tax=Variovorax sp. YR750 TaxID=1884384 RepID=UPI0008C54DAE|nr:hypothetical protein [Variovorax sp. YR750]SEK66897.1 hypothetical protein SAMN05518845_102329 [Variovorax sp. YR750]